MYIAFRVDSSTTIGHGHVMRCLTLAQALVRTKNSNTNSNKINISFITKANIGNINHLINKANNYRLTLIATGEQTIKQEYSNTWLGCTPEQDAKQTITALKTLPPIDLLIVDHYAIGKLWHQQVKPYCQQLIVIDDLANRPFDCDVLLDQTLNRQAEQYKALLPKHCQLLLGQNYMLLRDEFSALATQAKIRRSQQSKHLTQAHILITMGGSDPDNLSKLALLAVEKLKTNFPNINATLVLSSKSNHLKSFQQKQLTFPWCTLITDCENMAQLMLNSDIAIGASGATAWERCCLGLPSLITINAENQQLIATNLAESGAGINLGWHQQITIDTLSKQMRNLLSDPQHYLSMVDNCFNVCDGQGTVNVANFIIKELLKKTNAIKLRLATTADKQLTFDWQLEKNIRQFFKNPSIPTWQEHSQWFDKNLANSKSSLYILLFKKTPVGTLRLDEKKQGEYEVSILITTKQQGKGIALNVLKQLTLLKKNSTFFADIHQDNSNSSRVFKKAGFVPALSAELMPKLKPRRFFLNLNNINGDN